MAVHGEDAAGLNHDVRRVYQRDAEVHRRVLGPEVGLRRAEQELARIIGRDATGHNPRRAKQELERSPVTSRSVAEVDDAQKSVLPEHDLHAVVEAQGRLRPRLRR